MVFIGRPSLCGRGRVVDTRVEKYAHPKEVKALSDSSVPFGCAAKEEREREREIGSQASFSLGSFLFFSFEPSRPARDLWVGPPFIRATRGRQRSTRRRLQLLSVGPKRSASAAIYAGHVFSFSFFFFYFFLKIIPASFVWQGQCRPQSANLSLRVGFDLPSFFFGFFRDFFARFLMRVFVWRKPY